MQIRAVSSLDCYGMNHTYCARPSTEVAHLYVFRREDDLAITQRFHVLTMDAQTERPGAACMRSVKSSQPGDGTGVRFILSVATYSSTQSLGVLVREA